MTDELRTVEREKIIDAHHISMDGIHLAIVKGDPIEGSVHLMADSFEDLFYFTGIVEALFAG